MLILYSQQTAPARVRKHLAQLCSPSSYVQRHKNIPAQQSSSSGKAEQSSVAWFCVPTLHGHVFFHRPSVSRIYVSHSHCVFILSFTTTCPSLSFTIEETTLHTCHSASPQNPKDTKQLWLKRSLDGLSFPNEKAEACYT